MWFCLTKMIKKQIMFMAILTAAVLSVVDSRNLVQQSAIKVNAECTDHVNHIVPPEFLSVALDCSLIRKKWKWFDVGSIRLLTLAQGLSPAVLRMGGTDCDFAIFQPDDKVGRKTPHVNFTLSGDDWIKINKFSQKAGWKFLFDVNVLLRDSQGAWNPTNAKQLLDFNSHLGYHMDFQLGNEPNLFNHVSNITVSPEKLAKDFHTFKQLLRNTSFYKNSKLVGPDTTRPNVHELGTNPLKFLKSFLQNTAGADVDAVSWHQYYLNGRIATAADFTDVTVLDVLPKQIAAIQNVVDQYKPGAEIWLGETSSAYGGGAPGYSDTYIAGFLWLDKLGVGARQGLTLVIRQDFFQGHYSLIDRYLNPNPDYWLSLLYKRLVGQKVLDIKLTTSSPDVRMYAHCSNGRHGGVTLFALNLNPDLPASINLTGSLSKRTVYEYLLEPVDGILTASFVMLNGNTLKMVDDETLPTLDGRPVPANGTITLPQQTFAFYTIPEANFMSCK